MASNFGVVAYIKPPTLNGVTQPDLIKFETEYTAYKDKVNNMNSGRDDANKLPVATIKDCLDGPTLHALCIMGEISGATTLEQATANSVEQWFTAAHTAAPRDLSERIQSALLSVKHKPCKADPAGAAITFCLDAIKALDKNNASEIMNNTEKAKYLVDKLREKLEPDLLRERVRMQMETWTKEDKGDIKKFKKCLSALAVEVAQIEVARSRLNKKRDGADNAEKRTVRGSKDNGKGRSKENGEAEAGRPNAKKQKRGNNEAGSASGIKGRKYTCLNPDCDESHKMKDCSKTPDDMKKKLLEEYWEKKKATKVKALTSDNRDMKSDSLAEGRYHIVIEEAVPAIALGDSGADVSVLPENVLKKLLDKDSSIQVQKLDAPLMMELACKSTKVAATAATKLTIVLHLPGSNVPVRFRGIEFFVADFETDEVLLGRPFLNSIGFNLDKHLEQVSAKGQEQAEGEQEGEQHPRLASARYTGLTYQMIDDDPIELPESFAAGIGSDSKESIDKAFNDMIKEATENGVSSQGKKRLEALLKKYRDIFRIKLGADKPARVEPLKIVSVPGARPFKTPQRRYAPLQTAFINNTIRDLERVGAVKRNPSAKWASAALAVPKPGTSKQRFTVDLRGVNARTVPVQSAMPHFESKLQEVAGSRVFATTDLAHGYWQIPLHPDSQEMMSIQTPLGMYTPTRLLQGGVDSGNHFQAVLQGKFEAVRDLLQWIDDFLLHAKTENALLDNLEKFFIACKAINLKLHAEKTTLFSKEVTFCGRSISEDGVRHQPRHFEALQNMQRPTMASDLQQFLCATNWMRTSLPNYAAVVAPLHELLESVYKQARKRTKAAIRKVSIQSQWEQKHEASFTAIKSQLVAAVKLAHVKEDNSLCLFTDASETHWASILTQVPKNQRKMDVEEQHHEPLCFSSGSFRGASSNWSVPEKEGFAIVESMTRLDHIVMGREVNIFTDHANLVYLYDPQGRNPGMPRHTATKLMRWALKLSAYRYVVEHLAGERNVWADMLTRWAVAPHTTVQASKVSVKSLLLAPVSTEDSIASEAPTEKELRTAQAKTKRKPSAACTKVEGLWKTKNAVWVPEDDEELKLRIIIAAHAGTGGHRGQKVTLAAVQSKFQWSGVREDVKSFVSSCLHCECAKTPSTVPRPLGHALHADKPNQLLHFDFLYMMPGENNLLYILIIKDDHSGYVWLVPVEAADSETVADSLIRWFTTFGVATTWVSDRGSHFKNVLMAQLRSKLNVSHHFTLAYSPWSNGTVEVVCREVLRACRALLSELQLPLKCWPDVVPMVQSALNNSILPRLGNRCPQTVFTGLPHSSPISTVLKRDAGVIDIRSLDEIRVRQRLKLPDIQKSLDAMHKEVHERNSIRRKKAIEDYNRKVGVRPVNFTEGDFVLRGILQRERAKKPALRWTGPYRVVRCLSEYIFLVEHLLTGKKEQVHGRRLKFFRNASFGVTEELKTHLEYQEGEMLVIDRIDDVRLHMGKAEALVVWKGFGPEETDWVEVESLHEDVPVLLKEALETFAESGTARQRAVVENL